jgi:hypothetical protein
VGIDNISFNSHSIKDSVESGKKWFPYNKGGSYRKWYGNYDYVVNWQNDGYEIRHFSDDKGKIRSRPQNTEFYFKEAVTWSDITTSMLSARYILGNHIHDVVGMSIFGNHNTLIKILGFINSKVATHIMRIINPTIHNSIGYMVLEPLLEVQSVNSLVERSISSSKSDWDAFETSWDFQKNPLLTQNAASLHQAYNSWSDEALTRFNQLKSNEEELNRIFINLYGLQDELTPEEDDKEVSVRKADQVRDIKAFLSYFIGCVFGRYSLDEDGLVYAGGNWDNSKYSTFKPNKETP